MIPYKSPTPQSWKETEYTFAQLVVEPSGACVAAERKGGRKLDDKGLVVRYPNPFAEHAPPSVLYRAKEPLGSLWRAPDGTLHAGGKRHHHGAGAWKAYKLGDKLDIRRGLTTESGATFVIVRVGFKASQLLRVRGKDVEVLLERDDQFYVGPGLVGRDDDVYVATTDGIHHFDGQATLLLPGSPTHGGNLAQLEDGAVLADGALNGSRALSRGCSTSPFTRVAQTAGDGLCAALGAYYSAGSTSTSRVEGSDVTVVFEASGWTGPIAGNDDVLWIANGIELVCTDGKGWKSVARVPG